MAKSEYGTNRVFDARLDCMVGCVMREHDTF